MRARIKNLLGQIVFPVSWPTLEEELELYRKYFQGKVLNAGSGGRDISHLIQGQLINLDLPGMTTGRVDIEGSLENIPLDNNVIDVIICNAVLEHVQDPGRVMEEFYRVLKPGGYLYLAIPFMQPEHNNPGDFQRYTKAGINTLAQRYSFNVIETRGLHTVYHTLGWILFQWFTSRPSLIYQLLAMILFPIIKYKSKVSKVYVDSIASAYSVFCQKV